MFEAMGFTHVTIQMIEAWNLLSEMNLLGRIIWEMRTKALLGVIS
jgi:hypothetical protein